MKYNFIFVIAAIMLFMSGAFAYTMFLADPSITPSYMNKTTNTLFFKFYEYEKTKNNYIINSIYDICCYFTISFKCNLARNCTGNYF